MTQGYEYKEVWFIEGYRCNNLPVWLPNSGGCPWVDTPIFDLAPSVLKILGSWPSLVRSSKDWSPSLQTLSSCSYQRLPGSAQPLLSSMKFSGGCLPAFLGLHYISDSRIEAWIHLRIWNSVPRSVGELREKNVNHLPESWFYSKI